MRIGIYAGNWQPNSGGGYCFFETILNGLINIDRSHTFYVFHDGKSENKDCEDLKFISLSSIENIIEKKVEPDNFKTKFKKSIKKIPVLKNIYFEIHQLEKRNTELTNTLNELINEQKQFSNYDNVLNRKVQENKIELMWFVTIAYLPVQCPFIYTLWDLAHINQPWFPEVNYNAVAGWQWEDRERLYSNILRKSAYIIVGTETGKAEIVRYYSVSPNIIRVIPFPITIPEQLQTNEKNEIDRNYIIYPAQFWPHKNHICILNALRILYEKYNIQIKCIFTGSDKGNEKYIKHKVSELKLDEFIEFRGFIPKETLTALYKNAFALVFPTFLGPDNLPPIEAFSLGCPVIASDIDGAREQLKDAALLFDPTSEEQLANCIKLLIDDRVLSNNLIAKGLEIAKSISIDNYFSEMSKIFEEFSMIRRCWDTENTYKHL